MIKLHIEPKTSPMSWERFVRKKPPHSIAVDGFVDAPPRFIVHEDPQRYGPYANIDHHAGVTRHETRASCAQALIGLRSGLLDAFRDESKEIRMEIFANDCDPDVCLTTFLLINHQLVTGEISPRLSQLVNMEDLLDSTAGAYKFPRHLIPDGQLNWIFEPYDLFRLDGGLDRKISEEYRKVILDVHKRIQKFIDGRQDSLPLDTTFNVLKVHPQWSMIEETGRNARVGVFKSGIKAFVSIRLRPDGRHAVSIGRSSIYVHKFNVPRILEALNRAECCEGDKWGGAPTIGGSPRVNGTCLSLERITEIINGVIAAS